MLINRSRPKNQAGVFLSVLPNGPRRTRPREPPPRGAIIAARHSAEGRPSRCGATCNMCRTRKLVRSRRGAHPRRRRGRRLSPGIGSCATLAAIFPLATSRWPSASSARRPRRPTKWPSRSRTTRPPPSASARCPWARHVRGALLPATALAKHNRAGSTSFRDLHARSWAPPTTSATAWQSTAHGRARARRQGDRPRPEHGPWSGCSPRPGGSGSCSCAWARGRRSRRCCGWSLIAWRRS